MLWKEAELCGRKGTQPDQTEEKVRGEIQIMRRTQSAISSLKDQVTQQRNTGNLWKPKRTPNQQPARTQDFIPPTTTNSCSASHEYLPTTQSSVELDSIHNLRYMLSSAHTLICFRRLKAENLVMFWGIKKRKVKLRNSGLNLAQQFLCSGFNNVPPKFMSTFNLRIGYYLEIGSL